MQLMLYFVARLYSSCLDWSR